MKPVLDKCLGLVLAVLLAPVALAVALAILTRLGRPVVFAQTRIGKDGRPFRLYKFRSMTPDRREEARSYDGPERRVSYEATDDPRHTPLGLLLRRWSLDELPQLWNVVRGDMSLVGPRPEVPQVVAGYPDWAHERHLVRPGLTGWWQVSARMTKPMQANVGIDVNYVRRVSFGLDLRILLATVPAVLATARVLP